MHLTIESLFSDAGIVAAIIDRVLQTRKDRIYWQQYLTFRQTTQRVFKSYLGTVTGVMAGSINSRFGEKPIRERRNIGSGYGEIAYLGDAYQMSVDRLSELQDPIDKFNVAKPADQQNALNEIIAFVMDDFRQVSLAAHKRMDIVVGSLLMTGSAVVKNKDNRTDPNTPDLLEITLPFYGITPTAADAIVDGKLKFLFYLRSLVARLNPQFGAFEKMVMSLATFNKYIVGTSEFGETFRSQLGNDQFYLATGLIGSERASQILRTLGLPGIEIKEDYVEDQAGKNVQKTAKDPAAKPFHDADRCRRAMAGIYLRFAENDFTVSQFETFLRIVLEGKYKSVLWHCTAGKDRTGFATAIILKILGVDDASILEDYMLTNEYWEPEVEKTKQDFLKENGYLLPENERSLEYLHRSWEEYLNGSMARINEIYGDFDHYVSEALHITDAEKEKLQEMYLE